MEPSNAVFLYPVFSFEQVVVIGSVLIGLSILGYGLWAAMTQRLDGSRIWIFFVASLLVTAGPFAILWFINLMKRG